MPALRKISLQGWYTIVFLTLWGSSSFAQVSIIKGLVRDEETALYAATVSVANISTVTSPKGEFSIVLNPGTYILVITHAGYKKFEQQIIVQADKTQTVTISLVREEQLGEVVVLGTRSVIQRSYLQTAVPVDLFTSKELLQTGQPSLIQMLNFAAPSFNVSRQHLAEPVTLRGLNPDHLLILMNGIRFPSPPGINSGGTGGILGRGAVGNDLHSIPFPAVAKVEILRDGASSQYGSDAIAGVMNFILKKSTGKTAINLHLGQQYKGDGEGITFGINHGITIFQKRGFLNFSGDLHFRKPTHRGGEYLGTIYKNFPRNATREDSLSVIAVDDSIISSRNFSRKTPVSNDGSIERSSAGFLVNGGYPLKNNIELFWTGAISYHHPVVIGQFRFPKDPDQVNTNLYPDGFKPTIIFNTLSITGITGARGTTSKGWIWEWSSVYGQNSTRYYNNKTNNASQVAFLNPQINFYAGSSAFSQQSNNISLARDFAKELGLVKSFNVSVGAEYKFENYWTRTGEVASWENYDTSGMTQGGSQPAPGIRPEDLVDERRSIAGFYIDLETDLNAHFLVNVSGRFEHYDDFGNNLAGKLAMRYKFSSKISLRGSVSNGYHAPALQQAYHTSTKPGIRRIGGVNVPVRLGTFSNNSAVAMTFGVKPLQPEKAVNLSSGFTSSISPTINITVDAYWIQIKDRIVLSGVFDKKNPDVNRILQNMPDIDQVQFITNAINTRTRGIDIVMNGNWKIHKAAFGFLLAANFTQTNVFGPVQTTDKLPSDSLLNTNTMFNREERERLENGQPGSKIILSANYKRGKVGLQARSTRFGKTSRVIVSSDLLRDEFFSAKVLTDFSITYSPITSITITAGANNVFNVYPDRVKNIKNTNLGIIIYSNEAIPYGYNGGYYFLNISFKF